MTTLSEEDRLTVREALTDFLQRSALPFVGVRLRLFGERNYRALDPDHRAYLQRVDTEMFNWSVDRVQRIRRLLKELRG